jgi:hypothetical protein
MRKEDTDALMAILAQAGPKGKELATALASRQYLEVHLHISGPIVMGAEVVRLVMPMLIRSAVDAKEREKKQDP